MKSKTNNIICQVKNISKVIFYPNVFTLNELLDYLSKIQHIADLIIFDEKFNSYVYGRFDSQSVYLSTHNFLIFKKFIYETTNIESPTAF
jgi:hypothetical protein